jgi:4-aminobutyrate aminotransferase-like enzyme
LMQGLQRLAQEQAEHIGDVRGEGLFIGVEFITDPCKKQPSPGKAAWFKEQMKLRQVRPAFVLRQPILLKWSQPRCCA